MSDDDLDLDLDLDPDPTLGSDGRDGARKEVELDRETDPEPGPEKRRELGQHPVRREEVPWSRGSVKREVGVGEFGEVWGRWPYA